MRTLAWFYFSIGEKGRAVSPLLPALLSTYRPPLVVVDLALDTAGRGRYEVFHRPMGLAVKGYDRIVEDYRLIPEGGGILCYSWCTPDFILGTPMVEPRPFTDWTAISDQNRWSGLIFAGGVDARIIPQLNTKKATHNALWSVQRKGSLICQKLKTAQGADMRIWFSKQGLTTPTQENGWLFVEAPRAYAAVRVVTGGTEWQESSEPPRLGAKGIWLRCADEWSPVIFEVASKTDFADFPAFRRKVGALPVTFTKNVLKYQGLSDDAFTFYADQKKDPRINGRAVNYAPPELWKSPFINSVRDSGVVTISKDGRELVLNF